jgi:SAM-dependent methyltransferase
MLIHPEIDRRFQYASPFLKRMLGSHRDKLINGKCMDLPCGNGRNTFLLASQFEEIKAIDIDERYLKAIEQNEPEYEKKGKIILVSADLLGSPFSVSGYGLICNIHFWHMQIVRQIINKMSPGALLLIESPGCHGANYKLLPNRVELVSLFSEVDILFEEFTICKHPDNNDKRGPLKLLIKK